MPALELLLTRNRLVDRPELFEPDKPMDTVLRREAFHLAVPMLPQPGNQIRSHADVERAIFPAREDVDTRLLHLPSRHPELVSGSVFVKGSERLHNGC